MTLDKPLFPRLFKGIAIFTPGGDLIYCIDPNKQDRWHLHLCAGLQEILGLPEPPHFLVPAYTATIDRWLDPQTHQLRISAEVNWLVQRYQALLNAVFGIDNLVWQVAPWQEDSCDPIVLETYRHQFPQLWEDHDLIVRFDSEAGRTSVFRDRGFSYSYREPYTREDDFAKKDDLRWSLNVSATTEELPPVPDKPEHDSTRPAVVQPGQRTNAAPDSLVPDVALPNREADSTSPHPVSPTRSLSSSHADSQGSETRSKPPSTPGYVLRLFVSGHTAATEQTLKSLHQLLEHSLSSPYTLQVIDVFKHPDRAEANQISATPTLLRVWPEPVRKIVGDLTDIERVLRVLAAPE